MEVGSGGLMKIYGIVNAAKYQDILTQKLFASARSLAVDGALNNIMTSNIYPTHKRNV